MLRHLPSQHDPNLLVGSHPADDAAVYRLNDDLALVQTVDFFTPIVDDPYTFGQIAAANSLSDVYAVGGTPVTALNILAFPASRLSPDTVAAILRGGADKAAEAGVPIVGGHTIDDIEPKYGLSVTGTVNPERMFTAHAARPGDRLILTKPLGTGAISTALKSGAAREAHVAHAVRWMTTLNKLAAAALYSAGVKAVTDVTGYGLLGHLTDMCEASGVAGRLSIGSIPFLPGALDYIRAGYTPGGTMANLEYVKSRTQSDASPDEDVRLLLADPQTSGGLLGCVPPRSLAVLRSATRYSFLVADIGEIRTGEPGTILLAA